MNPKPSHNQRIQLKKNPVKPINNNEKEPQSKESFQDKPDRVSDIDEGLKIINKEFNALIVPRAVNHVDGNVKNEPPAQQQPTNTAGSKQVTNVINSGEK